MPPFDRRAALLLIAPLLLILGGCGGSSNFQPSTSSSSRTGEYLYVSNADSATISAFTIDASGGGLTAVTNSPFSHSGMQPMWLAWSGSTLFMSSASPTELSLDTISSSGELTRGQMAATSPVRGIAASASGDAVIAALGNIALVQAYHVFNGGLVSFGTGAALGPNPASLSTTPDGKLVFVVDNTANEVAAFAYDSATGNLTAAGTPAPLSVAGVAAVGAYRSTVDPGGKYLFVDSTEGYLFVFTFDASGALTQVGSPVAVAAGDELSGMTADPSSQHLYVLDRSAAKLYTFEIGSGGGLTAVGSPVNTGSRAYSEPESVASDSAGKFLYVTNRSDDTVGTLSIGSNGVPALTTTTPVNATPIDLVVVH